MGVVQRRLLATVVLALTVAAGTAFLQRDSRRREAAQKTALEAGHLLQCPPIAELMQVTLTGGEETLVLDRQATQDSIRALKTNPRAGAWQLTVQGRQPAVEADSSTVAALLQASCELQQLGEAIAVAPSAEAGAGQGQGQGQGQPSAQGANTAQDANMAQDPNTAQAAKAAPAIHPAQAANPLQDADAASAGANLATFGLAPPVRTLQLKDVRGKVQALEVGHKSSFDGSLFVRRRGEAQVRRVDGGFAFQVERDGFALREKRLAHFAQQDVQTLRVARGDAQAAQQAFVLARTASGYTLHAGPDAPDRTQAADPEQARSLLAALSDMRSERFYEEAPPPSALSRYGLDRPHVVVTVEVQAAADGAAPPAPSAADANAQPGVDTAQAAPPAQQHTLRFGRITLGERSHDFVQADGVDSPIAGLAGTWLVDKLLAGAQELRDMHVLHVERDSVASFEISEGSGAGLRKLRFVRTSDQDVPLGRRAFVLDQATEGDHAAGAAENKRKVGDQGNQGGPAATAQAQTPPLDDARVATALGRLTELRADTFDDATSSEASRLATGLLPAALVVSFAASDGTPLGKLEVGRVLGKHRAVLSEENGRIGRVFAAALEGIDADPNTWIH